MNTVTRNRTPTHTNRRTDGQTDRRNAGHARWNQSTCMYDLTLRWLITRRAVDGQWSRLQSKQSTAIGHDSQEHPFPHIRSQNSATAVFGRCHS